MKRFWSAFPCALALVAGACGGGGGRSYSVDELADAVVQESEAPKGTVLVGERSGRLDLERFASDESEKEELQELDFQGAQQAVYATPGLPEPGQVGGPPPPPDARLVVSIAAVFEDDGDAGRMYDFYRDDWLPSRLEGEESVPDPTLGQESFGTRFSSFTFAPYPGVLYLWRDGNAVFVVLRASPEKSDTTPGQVLELANAVEQRAQED